MTFLNNFFTLLTQKSSNIPESSIEHSKDSIDYGTLSIGKIQRKLNIGFNYAMNIMNALYDNGYVGEENEYKPRKLFCDEKVVWEYINDNLSSFRPSDYDTRYGINDNGGIYESENTYTDYDTMEGLEFENFCSEILEKNGFQNVAVTQGSGDHGIDILAEKDDISYAIQCKCYSSNIGNSAVQQAHTGKSLYHKDIAVVLTNRYFTQQAIEEANALGVKLWDRDKLDSMIKHSMK